MGWLEITSLIFCGALGAIVKDCVIDNRLELPKIAGGFLKMGFIGAVIIGAAAGYFVDHSPITAFLAGFAGLEAIDKLIPKKLP